MEIALQTSITRYFWHQNPSRNKVSTVQNTFVIALIFLNFVVTHFEVRAKADKNPRNFNKRRVFMVVLEKKNRFFHWFYHGFPWFSYGLPMVFHPSQVTWAPLGARRHGAAPLRLGDGPGLVGQWGRPQGASAKRRLGARAVGGAPRMAEQ